MSELEQYIKNWLSLPSPKPSNETKFIDLFMEFLKTDISQSDVTFDGMGSYGGNQVSINPDHLYAGYGSVSLINFEVVYSRELIKVYNGNHNGFYTAEYIEMNNSHERFSELKTALKVFLTNIFGLNEL